MINPISNASYLLPPLVAMGLCLALAVVVWYNSKRILSRRIFCGVLLSVGLWSFLTFGMRSSPDVNQAVLWVRALLVIGLAIYILYYHFTVVYTNAKGQRIILVAAYAIVILGAALVPTNLVVEGMRWENYGYAPVIGPMGVPLTISGLPLIGLAIRNLLRQHRDSHAHEERTRIRYLIIAVLFPLLGAILDGFTNLPPAAIWGNLIFCIICSVAILKYHLLDIRIVLRKSLVYLLISVMVATPYVTVLISLNQALNTIMEPWWTHALLILFLAIILQPLHGWAQQFIDRLFYRDRYSYLKELEQFSREAQSIVNLKELGSKMIQLIGGALRTSCACLLLPSKGKDGLVMVSSIGLESPTSGVVLRDDSPLVKWLKRQQRILSSEELNIVSQLQSLSLREKNNLKQMEAKLYVPILTGPGQLSGILVLGQKLSQQPYSSEDRQLLTTLSSQMAIALENARLYNESQREVEERKRAEELYRVVTNSSPVSIHILQDGKIKFANRQFLEQTGYAESEVLDRLSLNIVHPEDRETVRESAIEMLKGKRLSPYDFRYIRKSGEIRWSLGTVKSIQYKGNRAALGNFIDITERKQAEEREREMQQELLLSSRLASIGRLAAGVAHEINNPLTGIVGFSERLLRRSTDDETTEELQVIHDEAKRAAIVVRNLLTFSRRHEQKKELSNTNDIVQKTLKLRAYELKTGNIEVVTDLAPVLCEISVNFQQIQQVFLNIIVNAEQAMSETNRGGKLHIKTEKTTGYVRISFTDDGPGIPAEHLDKLFDPFFTTRGEKSGTGLGLSICHGIVTEHGGRIYAKSKPGKGTTFFVELPLATEKMDKSKVG